MPHSSQCTPSNSCENFAPRDGSSSFGDGDALQHDVASRWNSVGRWVGVEERAHGLHRGVEAVDDFTEQRVTRRQRSTAVAGDDEELAAVGVGAGVGHGQRTDLVLTSLWKFVSKGIPRATRARCGRVAALHHEVFDHTVALGAVEVLPSRKRHEVVHRARSTVRQQSNRERTLRGVERGDIGLGWVNAELVRVGELTTLFGTAIDWRACTGAVLERDACLRSNGVLRGVDGFLG